MLSVEISPSLLSAWSAVLAVFSAIDPYKPDTFDSQVQI